MPNTIESHLSTTCDDVRQRVMQARSEGKTTGVVMTMGALHEGHLRLVEACTRECEFTVVTIFVNPTQFLPGEDFKKYPRPLDRDLEYLSGLSVDVVFAPVPDEVYGPSFSTFIDPPKVAQRLEGVCRPGHFRGVCTVVLKLLQIVPAQSAFFGQKDYQQFLVIRQMAKDLNLSVDIVPCPTVREKDGLAMSSRNQYLDEVGRKQATAISRGLRVASKLVQHGAREAGPVAARVRQELIEAGITKIDYVAIADADTLEELKVIDRPGIALVAAYVGETRLIDNLPFSVPD